MLKGAWQWWSKRQLAQHNGRIYLPPLQQPVTVGRDQWGIPSIHAANRHDLLVAQGFVHAQDRLWQMELNRRVANGRLSELFGKITLETDRLTRTLGFARLARDSWHRLPAIVQDDLKAYTAGVNAFLNSQPRWPVEFRLMQHEPESWHPFDSLAYVRLLMWSLTQGATAELTQAWLLAHLGQIKANELFLHYPDENPVTLPEGVTVDAALVQKWLQSGVAPLLNKEHLASNSGGSNGWVIGAERSATGHAILCNDMHLPLTTPSLWHYQQLRSDDGWQVTGFTQPAIPYVLVGHNAHMAWGATLSYVDCEDLFVERLRADGLAYQFKGQWEVSTVLEEPILVRGGRDHMEQVVLTHHGPVVSGTLLPETVPFLAEAVGDGERVALTLQSAALQPEACFDGFVLLNEAAQWEDFVQAVSRIQAPSLNFLYADRADNIGHWVSGQAPVRAAGDGGVPAIGWTGEQEWIDTVPFAEMPHTFNPPQGYIVSANHRLTGADYPHFLGRVWRNGYRAKRIEMLINSHEKISIVDCQRFQLDFYSVPGTLLVAALADFTTHDAQASVTLELLRAWDGFLTAESVGGAVYAVLLRQLADEILQPDLPDEVRYQLLGMGVQPQLAPVNEFLGQWSATFLRLWQMGGELLPVTKRDGVMACALRKTAVYLTDKFGPETSTWQWGKLHQLTLPHPLGAHPLLARLFDIGPLAVGGDADTVMQAGIQADKPHRANGVSAASRQVIDLSDWGNCWGMLVPGQSGQLGSPHYDDLVGPWLTGTYWPMAWGEGETAVGKTAVGQTVVWQQLHPLL